MEKQIRGISWLKKIDMQKAGVRCRSSELSLLNEQHIELKEQYTKAQKCIVKEILTVAGKSSVIKSRKTRELPEELEHTYLARLL